MAQIAAFSVINPMEAANYRKRNLLSPHRHSSFVLNSHSSNTINPRSIPPSATIISQAKHQPKTIQIQNKNSSVPPNVEITKDLAIITQRGEYSTALSLFNELQLRRSFRLDLYIFNIAINCYCCVNRVGFGFSLLGGIFKLGYVPDKVIFTTLLNGLISHDKTAEAVELFKKIVEKVEIKLNVATYGSIMNRLCKMGNIGAAIRFLMIAEEGGLEPNTMAYSMIIHHLCKKGMTKDAEELLGVMEERGVDPDVVTYNSLMDAYCMRGRNRMDEAMRLLNAMVDKGLQPDTYSYNILIKGYSRSRKLDEALHLFREMPLLGLAADVVTYSSLIDGYCLQGRMDEALRLLNDMGLHPNTCCYNILINGYCKNMKLDEAMHLFEEIPLRGLKRNIITFTTILHGLVQIGRYTAAQKILNEMQAADLIPDTKTCGLLLDGLRQSGHINEAMFLSHMMEKKGLGLDIIK